MKKSLLAFVLLVGLFLYGEEQMGNVEETTKYLHVKTDYFTCTFFPKHIFPVWFKTPDGREFPNIVRYQDRVTFAEKVTVKGVEKVQKKAYWLYADLWAEQKVITNTATEFVIECKGTYCSRTGDSEAPGNVKALYTFAFKKDSPVIKVTAKVSRTATDAMDVAFLQPSWSKEVVFDKICKDGKVVTLQPGHDFRQAKTVTFSKEGLSFTCYFNNHDPIVMARYQMSDGLSSILTGYKTSKGKGLFSTGYMVVKEEK